VSERLKGKVALITSAASGMGAAQAKLFASEGAAVCVSDVNDGGGQAVFDEIAAAGDRATFLHLDVTDLAQWEAAVAHTERALGALTGAFLATKAVVSAMRRAGDGSIVNMGSSTTTRCSTNPGYASSKVGIWGLTKAAAKAHAKDGIHCNLVSPGSVDTPVIRDNHPHSPNDWSTSIGNPENYQRRVAGIPMGRMIAPLEVAYAFLFLASDEASMITGTNLKVDGGATL
jgi:NAD(P)-dependent dehydrogenase (short-subunit alcohol dehydrogenase family)